MSQLEHNLNTAWQAHPPSSSFQPAHRGYHLAKRLVDIVGSLTGMVLALPVIAGCALWIKLVDGGPVFYHQWRVGQHGWMFKLTKLRTMRTQAERTGAQFARKHDPRILPGCRWMRKSHLDELPQLWNILMGEMSLVGPRPERPEIMEQLRPTLPDIDLRLAGPPGLTGLAQLRSGYSDTPAGARRKLVYDLFYLKHRNFLSELRLLVLTIPKFWDRTAH